LVEKYEAKFPRVETLHRFYEEEKEREKIEKDAQKLATQKRDQSMKFRGKFGNSGRNDGEFLYPNWSKFNYQNGNIVVADKHIEVQSLIAILFNSFPRLEKRST